MNNVNEEILRSIRETERIATLLRIEGVNIGPGRGSSEAGTLTDADRQIFEGFLNPER